MIELDFLSSLFGAPEISFEKIDYIDFKDVSLLQSFVPERGRIMPRRITGTCAWHQRKLSTALKRARVAGLLGFVGE